MTDLALSALTNAILVALICFLAGLSFRPDQDRGSAAGLFAVYLTLAGLANLLGTIHHGFVEGTGHPADIPLRTATRVVIAVGVFTVLMSTARQFMPARGQRLSFTLGLLGRAGAFKTAGASLTATIDRAARYADGQWRRTGRQGATGAQTR